MANDFDYGDVHAGRRQHEDHYDYHIENGGRVHGREEIIGQAWPILTTNCGRGARAPLCCMSEYNSDVIDGERILSAVRNKRHGDRTS